ncbi:MAG: helix-turn-helix transcriptional regulator [Alphaproteobacteria bacterium]|nr:helix-turn-helix transcriptional regulator [Alphaproteobacteria bacterium]
MRKTCGKKKTVRLKDLRLLRDPKVRRAYDALAGEYAIAAAVIGARVAAGLTQAELARRMRTTQSAVARLESGRRSPSLKTLQRIAKATGTRAHFEFRP